MLHKIIVVCTGNICRSPIAEALLRQQLSIEKIQVCSAGIAALVHHPADPLARTVALEHGLDISAHRAQQATGALLTGMDLILTLDQSHSDWIRIRFPQLTGRTHKLGRWRDNADVADPYGKPQKAFEHAYQHITLCTQEWAKRLAPG